MPGPKAHKKSKSGAKRKPQTEASTQHANDLCIDVDDVLGWNALVDLLCERLELPDLSTRSGLKRVHADFDKISERLEDVYKANAANERILGGIISIYTLMCADSILRNKLFHQGLLAKLMPLISKAQSADCRRLAIRALTTITHHSGAEIHSEILLEAPALIKVLQEHTDDLVVAENGIATLAHAAGSIMNDITTYGESGPPAKYIRALRAPELLRVVVDAVRRPGATYQLIAHATELLQCLTLRCHRECRACEPAVALVVANLRSSDMFVRCCALGGLLRLEALSAEQDQRVSDPAKLMAGVRRGFPEHVSDAMVAYGPQRCEVTGMMQCAAVYQRAMVEYAGARERDLHTLGATLADLVLRNEFSIAEGAFGTEDLRTGRQTMDEDLGLGFTRWVDALPLCAGALRVGKHPERADMADILQMKFYVIRQRVMDAVRLAEERIEKGGRTHPYFFYVMTLGTDLTKGLRCAKKALRMGDGMTPFVRFALMHRAVEMAAHLGVERVLDSVVGNRAWEEGIAFLTSALDDAKAYVAQAPPDARHMKNVVYWYVCLMIAVKGPDLALNLNELEVRGCPLVEGCVPALQRLRIAEEIGTITGTPPPKTQLRLTMQNILRLYAPAHKEWGKVVRRCDALSEDVAAEEARAPLDEEKASGDFAAWLGELKLNGDGSDGDGDGDGSGVDGHSDRFGAYGGGGCRPRPHAHPKVAPNRVALYRCSWCGNPSAVLRKCSGCEKARYCDQKCQGLHWSSHKGACKT
ncbi:hypothetical protein CONPUDRAFT_129170 [Coniophora puteana RWD-64-598 SS2]|uniref:MYND-type domain-containing protein n=1 Tax=Coniophora puteana (strain RWD-64-598) TaxID=741705 RepID=A0A5M3MDU1_CONPW|nr:uncharacterized protein CONPUDRAFT_129170 [Coniophora puteana RWD-64-598 SS2]EIW77014.1 hypothetical protein CONPUDRAFT_129170 [Coniophora puteana RWD-64-598 SS2]